jgi:hypothetical protein
MNDAKIQKSGAYGKPTAEARLRVACDTQCGALEEPETPHEIFVALLHFKYHAFQGGCAHGRKVG